jgi:chaperonin GroES
MRSIKVFFALLVLAATMASGFRTAFNRVAAVSRLAATHKLDGIQIQGDLVPVSNNVLVRVKEAVASTQGGIFIPDNAKEKPTEGTVIATGPGRIHPETAIKMDMAVNVGDNVIYGKYDGSELKYDDVVHQLIKDDDVLLTYSGSQATVANVKCVKDNVLILLPPKEVSNVAGLIVSVKSDEAGAAQRPDNGEVVKVGPGRQAGNGNVMKMQVEPGDRCRFRNFAGSEVKIEGKEYLVIKSYDILAKWK